MRVLLICSLLALMMMMMVCEGAEEQMDTLAAEVPQGLRVRRQSQPPDCMNRLKDKQKDMQCASYCKKQGKNEGKCKSKMGKVTCTCS